MCLLGVRGGFLLSSGTFAVSPPGALNPAVAAAAALHVSGSEREMGSGSCLIPPALRWSAADVPWRLARLGVGPLSCVSVRVVSGGL